MSKLSKLSEREKEIKLNNQYQKELKTLLVNLNERTRANSGWYSGTGGGNDNADTLHNIYCDFGYPDQLSFTNFWNMYRRFGPATRVCDDPVDLTWLSAPKVESSERFLRELELLIEKTKLWNRVKGLDARQRVGRYAGMFVQVGDDKEPSEPIEGSLTLEQIHNLKPIYEGQLRVTQTEQDLKSENYGNPTMYNFHSSTDGDRNEHDTASGQIHPDRIIIAAEGADDGSIYGVSALENIYNDLMDLRKINGAGGEGFYQNTRNAPVINAIEGFQAPKGATEKQALEDEIDSFLQKWQKKFVSKGLKFEYPNIKLDNPKDFSDNSWSAIASGAKIPKDRLKGSQTGVLAGDKDSRSYAITVQSRRENYGTELTRNVLDWFINYGLLENTKYKIVWDDLTAPGDDDKLSLADKMAGVNEKMFRAGLPQAFDENEIREVSGFEPAKFELPDELVNIDDIEDGE